LFDLERFDEQLVASDNIDVDAPALRASEREISDVALDLAPRAAHARCHVFDLQRCAFDIRSRCDEAECELERVGDDLPQLSDRDVDARHAAPLRMVAGDGDDCVGDRQLVQVLQLLTDG
jgi:hypothetical protein